MLRLTASYLDAEDSETGEVPYLAAWTGSLNLNYRYSSRHNLGFSLVYNDDRQDTNDFVDDDPDSFTIANIFGSGQFTSALSYGFGIDNIIDKKVFDPAADLVPSTIRKGVSESTGCACSGDPAIESLAVL